jgi:hypothetical protein
LIKDLVKVFEEACKGFLKEQSAFILSGVSERALCGELMKYLILEISKTPFSEYYVDVEYNRKEGGRLKTIKNSEELVIPITCDIIVHSRGENIEQDNLIAIEMKKSTHSQREKNKDRERLIALTKDSFDNIWSYDGKTFPEHVCRYMIGVYFEINLESKIVEIEYYMKGILQKKYRRSF